MVKSKEHINNVLSPLVLNILAAITKGYVIANKIAEFCPYVDRTTVYRRIKKLKADGWLESRPIGDKVEMLSVVWSRVLEDLAKYYERTVGSKARALKITSKDLERWVREYAKDREKGDDAINLAVLAAVRAALDDIVLCDEGSPKEEVLELVRRLFGIPLRGLSRDG